MAISFDTESSAAMQKALAASSLRQQVLSFLYEKHSKVTRLKTAKATKNSAVA